MMKRREILNTYVYYKNIFSYERNTQTFKYLSNTQDLEYIASKIAWPIVIFSNEGRMGNCLNTYATIIAMSHIYPNVTFGASANVYLRLKNLLHQNTLDKIPVFGNAFLFESNTLLKTVEPFYFKPDHHTHIKLAIRKALKEKKFHGPGRILHIMGFTDLKSFQGFEKDVKKTLKLKDDLLSKAQNYLEAIRRRYFQRNLTLIGFHIRRRDQVQFHYKYFGRNLPDFSYYEKVINYYKRNFKSVVFIMVSDDVPYISSVFGRMNDVHIKEKGTPEEDFALLSSCDHSAMTVGSFGFWASFFAGGTVLYASTKGLKRPSFISEENKIEHFIPINYD